YFLNQVADRLIVLGGGRARVIEGDYETYQRLAQQEAERAAAPASTSPQAAAAAQAADDAGQKSEKRKRQIPYPQSADLEREIAELERQVAEIEDLLGQPATWRDPVKAIATQDRHKELKETLARLYEHWEEAVEFNA